MKYSQLIGLLAALSMIGLCYHPWCVVESLHITVSGVNGYVNENLNFGKQIIPQTFFSVLLAICFAINKAWSKRANIFIAFLNMGWAMKNYILFSLCRSGVCPSIQPALYLMLSFAILVQIMTFLPKLRVKRD